MLALTAPGKLESLGGGAPASSNARLSLSLLPIFTIIVIIMLTARPKPQG